MKRFLSIILVIVMLSSVMLSSCNVTVDTTTDNGTTNPPSSSSSTDKGENPPVDDEPEIYSITYECEPGKNSANNPAAYTAGVELVLEPATLDGYTFMGWVDAEGNPVSAITAEASGDVALRATWRANRNVSHPISEITNPVYDPYMFFVEGDEYVFIYYLGYIDRVPLDTAVGQPFYHNGKDEKSFEFTSSTANSDSIQQSTSKVTETTRGWQLTSEVGAELGVEYAGVTAKVTAKISTQQSGSTTNIEEVGEVTIVSTETINSQTMTNTFVADNPLGFYRYTNFALVDVFAVITFNPNTNIYHVSNFNSVRAVWQDWDYSAFSGAFDDNMHVELPFEFPDYLDEQIKGYTDGLKFTTTTDEQGHPAAYVTEYTGTATEIIIPNYYYLEGSDTGYPVVGISANAFKDKPITSITLGKHTVEIGDYAFYGCDKLRTISFENVESIGESAFAKCSSLTDLAFGDGIASIGANAFSECTGISSVELGEKNFTLCENAFSGCAKLTLSASPVDNGMLQNILNSGAPAIKIKLTDNSDIENVEITTPEAINYLEINGNQMTLENVHIISSAKETVLLHMTLNYSDNATGVQLYSESVTLYELTVNMNGDGGNAMQLLAESTDVIIRGSVTLNGGSSASQSGTGLIANDLSISSIASDSMVAALTVNGGDGKNGASPGIDGGDGGNAIVCQRLLLSEITILAQGGRGGHGGSYTKIPSDSKNGADGGDGGTGGIALVCDAIRVNFNSVIDLLGGNGGNGGTGEDARNKYWASKNKGGDGGNGGNGNYAIKLSNFELSSMDIDGTSTVNVTGGNGGNGGNGGRRDTNYSNGTRGSGGSAGVGCDSMYSYFHMPNLYSYDGTNGTPGETGGSYDSQ